MARPSKVAVPRPISSRITRERGVAWFRIAAVSTISTMKVERPAARSSPAPTRENSRSTMPICAASAGTKAPACARIAISAFWRRKVDLPAMFGPVTSHRRPMPPGDRSQSFGTKGWAWSPASAASTTGWRPRSIVKAALSSILGRVWRAAMASSPSAVVTSTMASAVAIRFSAAADSTARPHIASNSSFSSANAWSAAWLMRVARVASSSVVKRTALPMVWRWRNRSRLLPACSLSACCGVTSMK